MGEPHVELAPPAPAVTGEDGWSQVGAGTGP